MTAMPDDLSQEPAHGDTSMRRATNGQDSGAEVLERRS